MARGETTQHRIKLAARRLFAQRGIDGVSVRDIVAAAGQRNNGSLHYYFRTKEALVREIVVDGARLIDDRRNKLLDEFDARGEPPSLRDVLNILVWPSTGLGDTPEEEDTFLRFITLLQLHDRKLFLDALENKWNSGYQRCLAHIRRLLPEIEKPILEQRLVFMGLYLNAVMAAREVALEQAGPSHRFWAPRATIENFIDTLEAVLVCPRSEITLAALPRR